MLTIPHLVGKPTKFIPFFNAHYSTFTCSMGSQQNLPFLMLTIPHLIQEANNTCVFVPFLMLTIPHLVQEAKHS